MMMINLNTKANVYDEEKLQKCQEYILLLEEERRKIQVFQRELPLCLKLVTQAIETCKQELTLSSDGNEYNLHGQSECSEQTSSEGPVLEEFIPIKRLVSSCDDDDQLYKKPNNNEINSMNNDNKASNNSDWLRSARLWNQSQDPTPNKEVKYSPKIEQVVEVKRDGNGGASHLFKEGKSKGHGHGTSGGDKEVVAATSSSAETGESSGGKSIIKQKKEGQSERKQRRSWSAELHKKFLNALQQLGGSHVATPKQIKELMGVDGLTNDEVKSHLQKYRLHTRRPNNPSNNHNNTPQTQPQFVVVGGLWVPPQQHNSFASTSPHPATLSNGMSAPIATNPTNVPNASNPATLMSSNQFVKNSISGDHGSHSEGGLVSNSPVTSSSVTTTASPPAHCV